MLKIIFEIGHPGHVHQFKNLSSLLKKRGHEVLFAAKKKDCSIELLDAYKLNYEIIGYNYRNLFLKLWSLISSLFNLILISKRFSPDIFISRVSPVSGYASILFRKKHIAFNDTEHCNLTDKLALRTCHKVFTSTSFMNDLGSKQEKFNGITEFFYLDPNYFTPNPYFYTENNMDSKQKYVFLRFVSWSAAHDIGYSGLSNLEKVKLVNFLSKHYKVIINSESELPNYFEKYRYNVEPSKVHDLLYYSSLYIGEGSTMASEAALLGTPSIYTNELKLGYINQLVEKGIVFHSTNLNEILRSLREISGTDSEKYRKIKLGIANSFDDLNHYAYKAIVGENIET